MIFLNEIYKSGAWPLQIDGLTFNLIVETSEIIYDWYFKYRKEMAITGPHALRHSGLQAQYNILLFIFIYTIICRINSCK